MVEASRLEALEHFSVCSFGLAITLGMSYRGEANLGAKGFTIGPEETAGELRAVVGDDTIGYFKTADDASDELDSSTGWDGAHRFHFCPLGEFVNSHEKEAVAPLRPREGSQDVQPLDRKGP